MSAVCVVVGKMVNLLKSSSMTDNMSHSLFVHAIASFALHSYICTVKYGCVA